MNTNFNLLFISLVFIGTIKKVGLSVKNNHDRAEEHTRIFRNEADRIFKPFLLAREKKQFSVDSELFNLEAVSDCSVYYIRSGEKTITLNVANNSYIALLVCSRTVCKRDFHTKFNSESGQRAMCESVQYAYIGFNEKCKRYCKKLLPYPDLLTKFDEKHNKFRDKLKKAKKGLTKTSRSGDVDPSKRCVNKRRKIGNCPNNTNKFY